MNIIKTDVVVAGAGASGMVAAIFSARRNKKVIILEHNEKAGRKLLATGNGKCNFSNLNQNINCYNTSLPEFVKNTLNQFGLSETLSFFNEIGLVYKDRMGYLYPNSEQAASVCSLLLAELKRLKVEIVYNCEVERVAKGNDFEIFCNNGVYKAKSFILSTGGCASPSLGTKGIGHEILKSFGHHLTPLLPGLVQLCFKAKYLKTISGVRTEAEVSLYIDCKQAAVEEGEILFTDYGISGIPILQLSRFASIALSKSKRTELQINFLKNLKNDEITIFFRERIRQNPLKTNEELFTSLLNSKLAFAILKECGLVPEALCTGLTEHDIIKLIKMLTEFTIPIISTKGFDNAQVTVGGVSLDEINHDTMESRLIDGLYVTGELLDVDGTCGGYNLQWAFSSGAIAGKAQR